MTEKPRLPTELVQPKKDSGTHELVPLTLCLPKPMAEVIIRLWQTGFYGVTIEDTLAQLLSEAIRHQGGICYAEHEE